MVGFMVGSLAYFVVFLLWGCESFKPICLPHFWVIADDWLATDVWESAIVAFRPSGMKVCHTFSTSICASTFAYGICDLVTLARSVKASRLL